MFVSIARDELYVVIPIRKPDVLALPASSRAMNLSALPKPEANKKC
jgi:hypothetical protein